MASVSMAPTTPRMAARSVALVPEANVTMYETVGPGVGSGVISGDGSAVTSGEGSTGGSGVGSGVGAGRSPWPPDRGWRPIGVAQAVERRRSAVGSAVGSGVGSAVAQAWAQPLAQAGSAVGSGVGSAGSAVGAGGSAGAGSAAMVLIGARSANMSTKTWKSESVPRDRRARR
jgi:hypothetical protein